MKTDFLASILFFLSGIAFAYNENFVYASVFTALAASFIESKNLKWLGIARVLLIALAIGFVGYAIVIDFMDGGGGR